MNHRSKPKGRLFWRIYLNGILLLLALGGASIVVVSLVGDPHGWFHMLDRYAELLERDLQSGLDEGQLQDHLRSGSHVANARMAIFREGGEIVARNGDVPRSAMREPDSLFHSNRSFYRADDQAWMSYEIGVVDGVRHFLIIERPMSEGLAMGWLVFAIVLLVLALISYPLARGIAKPVERITHTARRLASGDLDARTGIQRRDEVGVLAGAVDEMAEDLQMRIRAEKELLANVSHELRTPLSRLRVALELCDETGGDIEQIRSNLSGMVTDVEELDRLIDDVLITTRLDLQGGAVGGAGEFIIRMEQMTPSDVIADVMTRFMERHSRQTLSAENRSASVGFRGDPILIRRALDNLLDNAAKYAGSDEPIELIAVDKADGIGFCVSDSGPGIPDDEKERVFEPFYRGCRSGVASGSGLGLALCRKIAHAHGGEIRVTNKEGGGAIFTLLLPGLSDR